MIDNATTPLHQDRFTPVVLRPRIAESHESHAIGSGKNGSTVSHKNDQDQYRAIRAIRELVAVPS